MLQTLTPAVLTVMDEMSMLGRMFMGKILYRVQGVLGDAPEHYGRSVSMGGLDVVVTGHPAQIRMVGDDYWWKPGPYTGKAKNLPPRQSEGPEDAPKPEDLVAQARLFLAEFEDVVILQKLQRLDEDGDDSMTPAERTRYKQEAQRWRGVTGRMADLEWSEEDWAWLSQRNRSVLVTTAGPRGAAGV